MRRKFMNRVFFRLIILAFSKFIQNIQHQNSSKSSQTSTKLECKAQSQDYIYDFNHITNVKKIEMTSVSCAKNGEGKKPSRK